MDLTLTPEQRAYRDEVRAFIRARLPDDIRERLRAGHPPRKQDTVLWQRILNERGWAGGHRRRRGFPRVASGRIHLGRGTVR